MCYIKYIETKTKINIILNKFAINIYKKMKNQSKSIPNLISKLHFESNILTRLNYKKL